MTGRCTCPPVIFPLLIRSLKRADLLLMPEHTLVFAIPIWESWVRFFLILIAAFFCESSEAWELFQELSLNYSYRTLVPETASKPRSSNRLSSILQC